MVANINQGFRRNNEEDGSQEITVIRSGVELDEQTTFLDVTRCPGDDCQLLSASDEEGNTDNGAISSVNSESHDWWTDNCAYSTGENNESLLNLHNISEQWMPTSVTYKYQGQRDIELNVKEKNVCKQRRWGHDWGLCPWHDGTSAQLFLKDSYSSSSGNGQCKPRTDRSFTSRRRTGHKAFEFYHVSDFKEYIRQYREKHVQVVGSQRKEQRATFSRVGALERALAPSSVAQVTDLSSLLPEKDLRLQEEQKLKSSVDPFTSASAKTKPDSTTNHNELSLDLTCKNVSKMYGCSRGLSVFRKSVDLSPIKRSFSSKTAINPVRSVSLIKGDDIIRRASKVLSTGRKYLNLEIPKHETHFDLKSSRKRETTVMSVEKLFLHYRKETCGKDTREMGARENTNTSDEGPSNDPSNLFNNTGIKNATKSKHWTGSSNDYLGPVYLGFCLNKLSTSPISSGNNKVENNMAAYQLTGRQLRGKPLIPRPGPEAPISNKGHPLTRRLYSKSGGVTPRVEKVNLGIKGNNLKCHTQHIIQTTNSLGIFDMPV